MMGQACYMPAPFSMCLRCYRVLFSSLLCGLLSPLSFAQAGKVTPAPDPSASLKRGVDLAKLGRCSEALPLLKKAYPQVSDKSAKRDAGLAGVRCGLFTNQPDATVEFLRNLNRDFPRDPDVLYVSVHAYSDLSTRAAQELAR